VVSLFGGRLDSLLIEKGMLLERGQRVAVVKEGDEPLEAFVFVPDEQGKQLKKGMKVQVLPSTVQAEEFGYIQGIAGVSQLSMEGAWEAAHMAGLDRDIEMMPMGMFTFLGDGVSTISGGQRQRLMIARAIASRLRILLFDEATSALDNRTQAIVSASLENLKATRIVIAHRLSTIINADRIYVLVAGRIVQSGTYAELMGQEGPFKDLAMRQIA
jgi:ABC-type transport system involved in Fe-S cluster assembly fused permease/ATPase subunit